jgi:ribosome-interacting GTPase 1
VKKEFVHDSKRKLAELNDFVQNTLTACAEGNIQFQISDVKGDGTVFVRFRGTPKVSTSELSKALQDALQGCQVPFTVPAENQVRLAIEAFNVRCYITL